MQSLTKILLLTFCAKASSIFWFFGSGSFDRCSYSREDRRRS